MADGRVVIDVILDDGQVAKGVADVDRSLGGLRGSAEKSAISIGKIASALGLVYLARKGIDLIRDSLQGAFQRIDTFEQFERVMEAVTGSTDETNKALERTNDIVTGTGYTLDGAARAVQNFVTRGATVDEATKYIEAWGDAVAFYGDGSQAQFENVTDALAKMQTKGTVGMDQLNRLFDAGIDAVGIYAQATGESSSDVQDALSAGEISAEQFIDTVSTAMMEGTNGVINVSGAAKEMGATWGSTFANMRTAVARGVANIIESIDEMLEDNGLPNMREMVAEFGSRFEEVLTNIGEKIPSIVESIMNVYNALKPWLPLILGIVTAFLTFQTIITVVAKVKLAFTTARLAVMAFNATLLANPIALIIALIVGLAVIIVMYWDEIKAFTIATWETVWGFLTDVWEWIKETFNSALQWIDDKTGGAFSGYLELVTRYMNMVWDNIKAVWEWVKNTFTNVLDFLKALVSGDFEGMKEAIKNQMENSRELISNIWENIKKYFGDILGKIWTTVKNKFTDIVESAREKMDEAKQKVEDAWNKAKEFLEGIDLFQIGKDIIQGLIDGIGSMAAAVWGKVEEIAGGIKDSIMGALGMRSPSRVMMDIGMDTGKGMEIGLEKSMRGIVRKAEQLAMAAVPGIHTPATAGATTTNTSNQFNFAGLFDGATFSVRDDRDIRELAKELGDYIKQTSRGRGIRV